MLKARTEMCPGIRGCEGPWGLWPGFQQKRDSSCKELSNRLFARLWAEYGKVVKAKRPGAESAGATTPRVKGERAAGSPGPEETGCRRATHQELGAPERGQPLPRPAFQRQVGWGPMPLTLSSPDPLLSPHAYFSHILACLLCTLQDSHPPASPTPPDSSTQGSPGNAISRGQPPGEDSLGEGGRVGLGTWDTLHTGDRERFRRGRWGCAGEGTRAHDSRQLCEELEPLCTPETQTGTHSPIFHTDCYSKLPQSLTFPSWSELGVTACYHGELQTKHILGPNKNTSVALSDGNEPLHYFI